MIFQCPRCRLIHDFTPAPGHIKRMLRDGQLVLRCQRCGFEPLPLTGDRAGRRRRLRDVHIPENRLPIYCEIPDITFDGFITKAWGDHPRPFTTHQ